MRLVGHPDLKRSEPRNDGQTLYHDQVIPGATLLGYANADHWAAAIPMEESKPFIAGNRARKGASTALWRLARACHGLWAMPCGQPLPEALNVTG